MTPTEAPELEARIVTALYATYQAVQEDVAGNKTVVVRTAQRGESIDLAPSEVARLEALGAIAGPGEDGATAEARREAALEQYRAERGDAEAVQAAVARALNPLDTVTDVTSPPVSVSPPSLGATPRGDVVTGDTGGPDSPPVVTDETGAVGGVVRAPEGGGVGGVVRADAPDVASSSVAELSAWISEESPNGSDTVALAEGDPELAAKVLEAERAATGGDPRKGVERKLTALAGTSGGDE
jgi:hypothetical protein